VVVLIEFIAFLITLTIPGYLLVEKHFSGLEKAVLSVFLSLSITSFLYYFIISFFSISKEIIYVYFLILLIFFVIIKKPKFNEIVFSIRNFKLKSTRIQKENLPGLLLIFVLVLFLCLTAFFISVNKTVASDDLAYHLPIIIDIADDGKKTFFSETKNIYEVRSNQFPLLFESFVASVKFFLGDFFYWFVSFFSLILSLFLIYFISKDTGHNQIFSSILYAFSPFVIIFSRYFYTDIFLSMFFLGSVFFVLNYVKTDNLFFLFVAGFLSGLMFLTKFTGGIFFAGLFLFLLYKRKFKESVFFGIIFVLVSLFFVVSHLTVPVEQVSTGDYGKFVSEAPLTQIPLNVFKVTTILFWYFSNYFYVIPILFFVGLFWVRPNEKDFSILFFISAVLFLGVTFVNQVTPTSTGFPRYFLPIYSLIVTFAGFQLSKLVLLKNKYLANFFWACFVLFILFFSVSILSYFIIEPNTNPRNYYYIADKIGKNSDANIWFVNGGAILMLPNATFYDYSWGADFSGNPCQFLHKNRIDYVIYQDIEKTQTLNFLGKFGLELKEKLLLGECSELFFESKDVFNETSVFKIK